jgi:outer membrane PBP1 activator LpoA protein
MTLLKLLLGVLLILSSPLLQAVCSPDQEPITVVLLLPLAEGSTPFGQSLLDGFIAANFGATIELDQKVYTWTDKVYITVVAPDHNMDSG